MQLHCVYWLSWKGLHQERILHFQLSEAVMKYCEDETPRKLTKWVLFNYNNAPAHMFLVSAANVRQCNFELVDRLPILLMYSLLTIINSQAWRKPCLGNSITIIMTSYLLLMAFRTNRMKWLFLHQWEPSTCYGSGRNVCTTRGTILKNIPYLVTFHYNFLESL